MDTLRGNFGSSEFPEDSVDFDLGEDDNIRDLPPAAIGQDERRMQVRAYNHWAGMLGDRNFPAVEELEPQNLDDFGPYSVLLDFSLGIDDPAVQFLGHKLAEECGADYEITRLSDVPSRSLLSRITDHYMQILANQAPIGFEAEFVNQRDVTILYRGILLPFSSDNETIDFIYGVINWKEMADAAKADELLLEIDQALEVDGGAESEQPDEEEPLTLTEIAPANDEASDEPVYDAGGEDHFETPEPWSDEDVPSIDPRDEESEADAYRLPTPAFGDYYLGEEDEEEDEANYSFASLTDHVDLPTSKSKALDLDELGAQQAIHGEISDISYDDSAFDPVDHDGGLDSDSYDAEAHVGDEGEPSAYETSSEDEAEENQVADLGASSLAPPDIAAEEPFEDESESEDPAFGSSDDIEAPDQKQREPISFAELAPKAERKPLLDPVDNNQPEETDGLEELPEDAGLYDYLASARELAHVASDSEDRSRAALYAAVGRAFDVALAAEASPEEYDELLAENGLVAQERAPMTPVVKLVFGADYDKTRLTEYATVLNYAQRIGLEQGQLSTYLAEAEGGLKGVVQAERRLRKEEAGEEVDPVDEVRSALAKKLRALEPQEFSDIDEDGGEFGLVMIRRTEDGEIVVLGEIEQDIPLIERAARKLLG
jgi:hypothetical protein